MPVTKQSGQRMLKSKYSYFLFVCYALIMFFVVVVDISILLVPDISMIIYLAIRTNDQMSLTLVL